MDYRKPALLVTTLDASLIPFMGSSVSALSEKCERSIRNLRDPPHRQYLCVTFAKLGQILGSK